MGKPFERVHACVAGKVDQTNKIPEWLRANGGTYSKAVTKGVTHLIATEEAYQKDDKKGTLALPHSTSALFKPMLITGF